MIWFDFKSVQFSIDHHTHHANNVLDALILWHSCVKIMLALACTVSARGRGLENVTNNKMRTQKVDMYLVVGGKVTHLKQSIKKQYFNIECLHLKKNQLIWICTFFFIPAHCRL